MNDSFISALLSRVSIRKWTAETVTLTGREKRSKLIPTAVVYEANFSAVISGGRNLGFKANATIEGQREVSALLMEETSPETEILFFYGQDQTRNVITGSSFAKGSGVRDEHGKWHTSFPDDSQAQEGEVNEVFHAEGLQADAERTMTCAIRATILALVHSPAPTNPREVLERIAFESDSIA